MGCCFSSSSGNKGSGKGGTGLKGKDGQYKTSAWSTDFQESKWKDDTRNIWERELQHLSVHMDLPRLGHKIQVFVEGRPVEVKMKEGDTKSKMVYAVLLAIADASQEPEETIHYIRTRYDEFVKADGSGDTSQQLKSFLTEVVPHDSRLDHVLSLCHQKIVFPAFYSIKTKLQDHLEFKDKRGSWVLQLFFEKGKCRVVHSKIQTAKPDFESGIEEFSFKWELTVVLSGLLLEYVEKIDVNVVNVDVHESVSEERAQEIRGIFAEHYQLPEEEEEQEVEVEADEEAA